MEREPTVLRCPKTRYAEWIQGQCSPKKEWLLVHMITQKWAKNWDSSLRGSRIYYTEVTFVLEKLTNIVHSLATDYFKLIVLSLLREWLFFILLLSRWWKGTSCSAHLGIHKRKSTHDCRVRHACISYTVHYNAIKHL